MREGEEEGRKRELEGEKRKKTEKENNITEWDMENEGKREI